MLIQQIKEELRRNGLEVIDYHKTVMSKEMKSCLPNPEAIEAVWILMRKTLCNCGRKLSNQDLEKGFKECEDCR